MNKKEFNIKAKELVSLKIEVATFDPVKKKYEAVKEEVKEYLLNNSKKSIKKTINKIEWEFKLSQKSDPKLSIPEENIDKLEELLNESGLENLIPIVIVTTRSVPEKQIDILKTALGEDVESLIEKKQSTSRSFYLNRIE